MQYSALDDTRYFEMFENSRDALILFKGSELIKWNNKASDLFDADGKNPGINDFTGLIDQLKKRSVFENIHNSTNKNTDLTFEFELHQPGGVSFNAEVNLLEVVLGNDHFLQCAVRDVTYLKDTAVKENYTEEKFKKIFNEVTDGILILSTKGEILEVNDRALKRSGYARSEFLKLGAEYFLKDDPLLSVPSLVQKINEKKFTSFTISYVTTYGFKVPVEVYAKKIQYEGIDAIIIVTRDISERLMMDKKIIEVEIEAQEKERHRVARELHDGISPMLSTIKLYAQSLQQNLESEIRNKILLNMTRAIDESIQAVSDISNNLSPHVLKHFGLITAIENFIEKIKENKVIHIMFSSNTFERIDLIKETYIYRIITELINNTLKHSQANNIEISLKLEEEDIHIEYMDDGSGFDFELAVSNSRGMGLKNMVNRIKALNGVVSFKKVDPGINYNIHLPLYSSDNEHIKI